SHLENALAAETAWLRLHADNPSALSLPTACMTAEGVRSAVRSIRASEMIRSRWRHQSFTYSGALPLASTSAMNSEACSRIGRRASRAVRSAFGSVKPALVRATSDSAARPISSVTRRSVHPFFSTLTPFASVYRKYHTFPRFLSDAMSAILPLAAGRDL